MFSDQRGLVYTERIRVGCPPAPLPGGGGVVSRTAMVVWRPQAGRLQTRLRGLWAPRLMGFAALYPSYALWGGASASGTPTKTAPGLVGGSIDGFRCALPILLRAAAFRFRRAASTNSGMRSCGTWIR